MSQTMTTTIQSIQSLAESIQLKECFTVQINSEYLNRNFMIIKQCLLKVQQIQADMKKDKADKAGFEKQFNDFKNKVQQNQQILLDYDNKLKVLQNNIGDDFMKKLYDIETKTKNIFNFDETVEKLDSMNIFVKAKHFNQNNNKLENFESQIQKLKSQLTRYVETAVFDKTTQSINHKFDKINQQINQINLKNNQMIFNLQQVKKSCDRACKDVDENNKMLKQINFAEMQEKLKKFRQESDQRIGELSLKIKKKCGLTDLSELETNIIERLDKFFGLNQKEKANVNETKNALIYLEKRVNQIYEFFSAKQGDEENDALFSTKKIHCASCTKDMGKYEGRLGQFKPWAVFPCKQLDPEKTGGYGFVNYIDKVHYRRGSVTDDSNLQRLNKTFYSRNINDGEKESPSKMNTTRTTSFMNSYGQSSKNIISLKDQYFKEMKNQKNGNKFFRVKKELVKPTTALETTRERVKEM